jgi:integrase
LRGQPDTPEFIADLAAAEKHMRDRLAGTFNNLVRMFTLSTEFDSALAPSTKIEYRRMLTKAEAEFGDMPIAALEDPQVRRDFMDWREKVARASGEREADNRLSAVSAMLTWAIDRGHVTANHLRGFKRLYHADRSEIIWLPEYIAAFMAAAPIEMQRAMILALHSGQRQGDLLRLPWSAYDSERLTLRQGKSRRGKSPGPPIVVPCTTALRRMLDSMERTSPLILTTKTGQSFKKRYFARLWDETAVAAGLEKVTLPGFDEPVRLHFHDLRGTTVTLLSESGSTPQQIAPITGHSLKTVNRILERYLARTSGLAEQAIFNWENSERTKFANQLQTGTSAPITPKGKADAQ